MSRTPRLPAFSFITAAALALVLTAPASLAAEWATRTKDGLLNINFPGGTVAEYCQGLREASPNHSIIVEQGAAPAELPEIVLNAVTPSFAVSIISELKQGIVYSHHPSAEQQGGATLDIITADGSYGYQNSTVFIDQSPPRFDLTFPGGTVNDFVQVINRAKEDMNIVVMPGARDFPAPPVELRGVTVNAALEILNGQLRPRDDGRIQKLNVRSLAHGNVYRIEVDSPMRNNATNVWSVAEMLLANDNPDVSADQLLAAIQAALSLYQNPAKVLYHEQLALIIIRGPQEQINVADMVIDRSFESATKRAQSGEHLQRELALLEHQMRVAESQTRVHEKEHQIAQGHLVRLEQLRDEDKVGSFVFEFAEAELRLVTAEAELTESRSNLQLVQQEHSRILRRITASKNSKNKR